MTVRELLIHAAEAIEATGAGNPRFEAELLLARVLDVSRVFLMTHPEHQPSAEQRARFDALLARRLAYEPLQYVLGDAIFRHLTLRVQPGVLIPRSETEVLVEHARAALERWRARHARGRRPWVIDVGVGSGAILLSLMQEARGGKQDRHLWFRPLGIDISPIPLQVTAENAAANDLPIPRFAIADLLAAVNPQGDVAAIVSNPPYIATGEMPDLPAEIREHEPHEALHGGADGLAAIRVLLDQARPFVERGAVLCFEIGATQGDAVQHELARRGLSSRSVILPDLAQRPRVVLVEPRE